MLSISLLSVVLLNAKNLLWCVLKLFMVWYAEGRLLLILSVVYSVC
jgi:hypothetical protein